VTRSATVYSLLVSRPGDISADDLLTVTVTINRWNVIYGPSVNAVFVSIRWDLHSAAQYGERPQEALNKQLIADTDVVIALFWHRIGTPTGEAESGTIEEIELAHENGAYVGILRCTRAYPKELDTAQLDRLREFLEGIQSKSLTLDYADKAQLAQHVDTILTAARAHKAGRVEGEIEASTEPAWADGTEGADVWPHVESSEQVKTDARGRTKTERRWELVLTNTGSEPARNVQHRLEPENEGDQLPIEINEQGDARGLEVLAPGGNAPYVLALFGGIAPQARCVVTWEDSAGTHENRATLRFY
jgi:hypothetical protein